MLSSSALGAGIFGLPAVLKENGMIVGIILLAVGGVFSAISQYYLIKLTRVANERKEKEGLPLLTTYSELLQYSVEIK